MYLEETVLLDETWTATVETTRRTKTIASKEGVQNIGEASILYYGGWDPEKDDIKIIRREPGSLGEPIYRKVEESVFNSDERHTTDKTVIEGWNLEVFENEYGESFVRLEDIKRLLAQCSMELGFSFSVAERRYEPSKKGDDNSEGYSESQEDVDGDGEYDGPSETYDREEGEDYDGDGSCDYDCT